jgi:DNA-binding NarL/FixJ family response regulator
VSRTRVAIADDDVLLREGLASLLERSGFAVLGTAGNAEQLLDLVRREGPELVIVDIRMPPGLSTEGLDAADVIRRQHPETAVLMLSALPAEQIQAMVDQVVVPEEANLS